MSSTKLTPLEVLHRQKARLQLRSDALIEVLEENLEYMRNNMGTIIRNSAMDAVASKTPRIVQSLLGMKENSEPGVFHRSALLEGALDILPFFIRESKGWLIRLALKQVKKWIFKRK
jgi:hypothetical protein